MAEAGGPATQAGIYYQNTIAALYLGRMLDLRPRPARHRVIHVRLEAPEAVDDVLVRMGDGTRRFLQAKLALDLGSDVWKGLWLSFARQLQSSGFATDDRLVLVIGEASHLARDLRACCERTASNIDDAEYLSRLTITQERAVDAIVNALADSNRSLSFVRRLLAWTDVEIMPDAMVERDYAPLWMPEAPAPSDRLLGILRDMAGGESRTRDSFDAARLRARLKDKHDIEISEPGGWGSAHYRAVISGRATIEVPGTGVVKPLAEAFLWPKASRYDRARRSDFDDETPRFTFGVRSDQIDLSLFPGTGLDRVVVIAGPGFGKSVLTLALAAQAISRRLLPVLVPIPELSKLDVGIGEYLADHVNKAYEVAIDWMVAAEAGLLVVLFDGLDEVASDRRATILERIKTFSQRHPATPWLLTVRDAAALAAPTDALLVELEPLEDDQIARFVAAYRSDDSDLPKSLSRRFEARPDLQRLVRIPLFLAILLATLKSPDELPSNRTALLETYLDLLFRPEQFKATEPDLVDPTILRPIAEAVAFEALEREEIGVGARLLETAIRHRLVPGTPVQPVIERLVKCGALRRTSPGQYVFPFPIIQEYLAACHILAVRQDEVPERLPSAVKRPWAQALQFVLEQHPSPRSLVRDLLIREDDAFNTHLRLVARCMANGMAVDSDTYQEIARRLSLAWPHASWRLRKRIGELIRETFCDPLVPEVRAQLSKRWLLNDGAGAIVARIGDPNLTRAVLGELLDGDVESLLNLGDLQAPVDALGDEALSLYAARARDPRSNKERDAVASLIGHLDGRLVSEGARLSVAVDERLPLAVRLAAFALGPAPIDARARPLIEAAIAIDGFQPRSAAMDAMAKTADPPGMLRAVLLRTDIPLKQRLQLVNYLPRLLPDTQRLTAIRTLGRDPALAEDFRWRLLVYAARYGDETAMTDLVSRLGELPVEIVGATISLFGHHRSRALAELAVRHLRDRSFEPRDRVGLTSSAVVGVTALFEMDWFLSGGVKSAPPHPGLDVFRELLDQWGALEDYTPLDALRMDQHLADAGLDAATRRLPDRIAQVLQAKDIDLDDDGEALTVGRGIRTLQERRHLLSLPLLESVVARCSYNGASSAVQMIAALGTREAFDSLLAIHANARDWGLKNVVLDAIESLAGRLGLRVRAVDGYLEASGS